MKDPEALLRSVLDVGECILPGGRRPGAPARWPSVFVHGLLGWGGNDALNRNFTSESSRVIAQKSSSA